MNLQHRQSFRPRLESLDDRACPSCTASLVGGTLTITGDELANTVIITDLGELGVQVDCDGVTTEFTDAVDWIAVNSAGGDDDIQYQLQGADMLRQRLDFDLGCGDDSFLLFAFDGFAVPEGQPSPEIRILGRDGDDFASAIFADVSGGLGFLADMGAGNDNCHVSFSASPLGSAPVELAVLGGVGDDFLISDGLVGDSSTLTLTMAGGCGDDSIINDPWLIGGDATMVVNTIGGSGDDFLFETYGGYMSGRFQGRSDGGNGADTIDTALGWEFLLLNAEPGSQVNYEMNGGNGDDLLRFYCVGRIDGEFDVRVNGGNGNDSIEAFQMWINALSTGEFTANFLGGNGDDWLAVQVSYMTTELIEIFPGTFIEVLTDLTTTPAPLSALSVSAEGGRGFDFCLHSAVVDLFDIEDDLVTN